VVYIVPLAARETAVVAVADVAALFTVQVESRLPTDPNRESSVRVESRRRPWFVWTGVIRLRRVLLRAEGPGEGREKNESLLSRGDLGELEREELGTGDPGTSTG
jgi:hypothetical protein